MTSLTRRTALQGAMGLGVTAALTAPAAAATTTQASAQPNFTDALTILRTHVKLVGSLGKEVVHSFMRLNI